MTVPPRKQEQLITKPVKDHPEAENLIWKLPRQFGQASGKKSYGYLPKPMKKLVDEIADQMVRLPTVDKYYPTWWKLQCQMEDYYSEEKKRIRPPLSQQKEFRQIKNAVIREAEHIRMNRISFEDAEIQDDGEEISAYDMSYARQELQSMADDGGLSLKERDEAAEQLEQLAESGDAYAQYVIGTAYRDSDLLIPNAEKARSLLEALPNRSAMRRSTHWANCISRTMPRFTIPPRAFTG